jgi:hypothetical protein
VTRPDSILNAISAPTVIWPSNTNTAPKPMTATVSSFSSSPITACAEVEIRPTSNRDSAACALRASQSRWRSGSVASPFTVSMP